MVKAWHHYLCEPTTITLPRVVKWSFWAFVAAAGFNGLTRIIDGVI